VRALGFSFLIQRYPLREDLLYGLQDRKPELTGELMTFRDHLLSSGVADTMNVWELKGDLSIRVLEEYISVREKNLAFLDVRLAFL
jgi:hypothetical protein